jgi:non-ribosomal peptide synthetase component F
VTTEAIHRVIEQHAAIRGDLVAIADRDRSCSYRELNFRANAVARHLIAAGFRRGGHLSVRMPRGIDLAVVLLATLKAGGSYTWTDSDQSESSEPTGVSISAGCNAAETRHLHLELSAPLAESCSCSPNLPILTRGSDIACVLADRTDGTAPVMVPHATITALRARAVTHPTPWTGEPGAFDLWMALMAGTTALVEGQAAGIVAA